MESINNVKISVIMGCYNCEKYVREAVLSILTQTYDDFEFIICDDASTDNTYGILKELAQSDRRIKLLKNNDNIKLAATLNKCITNARGEYVARMDADDISLPERFCKQIEFLEKNRDIAFVSSVALCFDEKQVWGQIASGGLKTKREVATAFSFVHPTVMIRNDVLRQVGGYSESEENYLVEDLELWIRLYKNNYTGYVLDEPLIKYRYTAKSTRARKYKYRVNEYKLRKHAYKAFALKKKDFIYVIKPLLLGFIPNRLLLAIKKHVKRKKHEALS